MTPDKDALIAELVGALKYAQPLVRAMRVQAVETIVEKALSTAAKMGYGKE